jgi:UTP--glucose-1-phosphate uridylyltransferase
MAFLSNAVSSKIKPARNRTQQSFTDFDLPALFAPFAAKMRRAGIPEPAIRTFYHQYSQLIAGATGHVCAKEAQPVDSLPSAGDLESYHSAGLAALSKAVVIKLNGGLGTTMGMEGPKSLIEVKQGYTFLDIIIRQILHLRAEHGIRLPLVLMNSFNTANETRAALAAYPELHQDVPFDFLQHKTPKIWKENLAPAEWPQDTEKEWCPPGHGDLYLALQTSGILKRLLEAGYTYAFISNADNLGATIDRTILGYVAQEKLPFLMEVAKRTPADSKGGHLAYHPQQGLVLRELAQCPPDEFDQFQDIERYRYFNTNNLWINLVALQQQLQSQHGLLTLPLIRNEKPINAAQPDSPRVYQLETAMGHAISLFTDAQAIQISRCRFLPVKSTNDLFALWSDAYILADDYTVRINPQRTLATPPLIDLDKRYFGLFNQLKERVAGGIPSLLHCEKLQITGDLNLDPSTEITGSFTLCAPESEPSATVR